MGDRCCGAVKTDDMQSCNSLLLTKQSYVLTGLAVVVGAERTEIKDKLLYRPSDNNTLQHA